MVSRTILLLALCGLVFELWENEVNAHGETLSGTVKWFDPGVGYGFLTPDDGSEDIFVHGAEVQTHTRGIARRQPLIAGQRVTFEVEDGPVTQQAVNIRAVDADVEDVYEINHLHNE